MQELKESFITIIKKHKGLFLMMAILFVGSLALLITSLVTVNSGGAMVSVGYGDIGGYRYGFWASMLAFPLLAFILGVLHNLLALRLFAKRGEGMTKIFVAVSIALDM